MNRPKAIIVDLDSTLCNQDHRQHYAEKGDWGNYYAAIPDDSVNEWCREIMHKFCNFDEDNRRRDNGYRIILLTGRPDFFNFETIEWLTKHQIDWDYIFMRSEGDFRPDTEVKKEIYEKDIEPDYDVLFAIDDRLKVIRMWRKLGLTCLDCAGNTF